MGNADQSPSRGTPLSLLERARGRDDEAWHRLVWLYQPLVRSWCLRGGVPDADADDTVQEVFAAVAAALPRFHRDQPGDTFRGWLRVITRRQVALYFRRNQDRARAEGGSDALRLLHDVADPVAGPDADDPADPLAAPDADDPAEIKEFIRRVLELVRVEFEERTWQAFWRSVVEAQPPAVLTAELGMSPAAIRQARSRVLRRVKQELGEILQ